MGHKGILGGNNNALSFDRSLVYIQMYVLVKTQ